MTPGLLMLLTFLAGVLAVAGVYSFVSDLVLKDRAAVSRRVDEEFRRGQRERVKASALFRDLGKADPAGADERVPFRQRLGILIDQSGLALTAERLLGLTAGVGLGAGVLAAVVAQSLLAGAAAGLLAATLPYLYVRLKRRARLAKMLQQLPDAFDLMARVVRAGQTTAQAVQAVADEFPQPLAGEFNYCAEQQNLGLSPETAFRDLARRTGLLEVKIFVLALIVQQQTGGNLAEVLDKLAGVIRERLRMKDKIQALTAEGRMQGLVLLILPFAVLAIMMAMNRNYAVTVIANPWLVVVMLLIEAVGAVWIRKVVNFDY